MAAFEAIRRHLVSPLPPEDFLLGLHALLGTRPTDPRVMKLCLDVLFCHQLSQLPLPVPLVWLTIFMAFRQEPPHPNPPSWMLDFFDTDHALFLGWSPRSVQEKVRCHSPTKRAGDPFADAFCAFVANSARTSDKEKRDLFVCAALILVPRSWKMLSFFERHGTSLSRSTIAALFDFFLDAQQIYPGLGNRSRQSHTTEQKILGLGSLIDIFLSPYLLDVHHFDKYLNLEMEKFVVDVSRMPWIQGPLLQVHFCDYLIYAGIMNEQQEIPICGKNSQIFLDLTTFTNFDDIREKIQPFLHFEITWRDVSSSACMTVRLMQAFLAGSTLGKGRFQEYRPESSQSTISLKALLQDHVQPEPKACEGSLLYGGCRYLTPRMFCAKIGWTNANSSGRAKIFDASRDLAKQCCLYPFSSFFFCAPKERRKKTCFSCCLACFCFSWNENQ